MRTLLVHDIDFQVVDQIGFRLGDCVGARSLERIRREVGSPVWQRLYLRVAAPIQEEIKQQNEGIGGKDND